LRKQRTIEAKVSCKGIGLHTGREVNLSFLPAEPDTGIIFRRIDTQPRVPNIAANLGNLSRSERSTSLGKGGAKVHTVEHVLAAVTGVRIDNIYIDLDSSEPPAMDGSALPFVELLKQAGPVEQGTRVSSLKLPLPVAYSNNDVSLVYIPGDGFKISFTINFDHPLLESSFATVDLTNHSFEKEIAGARTFCFSREIEELKKIGLIKGGNLENAIVITESGLLNEEPLRYPDEFVRHKILDLVGDLALLGGQINGHIIAIKSGHTANVEFVKKLHEAAGGTFIKPIPELSGEFGIQEIKKTIPHRYPFLLIDKVLSFEKNNRMVAQKNITINEPFFQGHFPEASVMPGVLIIEAIAQTGAVLLNKSDSVGSDELVYILSIDKARFRHPVEPGDQLVMEVTMEKARGRFVRIKGKAFVGEKLAAEAEILAIHENRKCSDPPEEQTAEETVTEIQN